MPSEPSLPFALGLALAAVLAAVGVVLLAGHLLVARLSSRVPHAETVARRCRAPGAVVAGTVALKAILTLPVDTGADEPEPLIRSIFGEFAVAANRTLVLVLIASVTWLVVRAVYALTGIIVTELEEEHGRDSTPVKRARTQIMLIDRVVAAAAVVIALGWMLFTFPAVQSIGAGLLASAGVAGIIAGVAAQKAIGNLFAGFQLAFSNALHVDDVVVAEGEWGQVEELTLTHVVVRIWDGRRLILPVSYFTEHPFENWTTRDRSVVGTVFLRVDWAVPVAELREHVRTFLSDHPQWDGQSWNVVVTDVRSNGLVEVRAAMSSMNGFASWDLCCEVRESLIAWVRENYPEALPRFRADLVQPESARS